jgi:hypothetical protein
VQIVMMHVGLNKQHTRLEKIKAEIAVTRRLIDSVNDAIKLARGKTEYIKNVCQPWKDFLLADYVRLAREETELLKSL